MKNKTFVISASAGSGKTTRIAKELKDRIADGSVRPECVLATTFTNKAADELKERARSALFRAGLTDAGLRLEGARIGTVNSVCGRLVSDFAIELGLSPRLRVIDEVQAALALRRVMSRVVTEQERQELAALQWRFYEFDWQQAVGRLMELARANRLGPEALPLARDRSLEGLLAALPPVRGTPEERDAEYAEVLSALAAEVGTMSELGKGSKDALLRVEEVLRALNSGAPKWSTWVKVKSGKPGVELVPLFARAKELAVDVDSHPRLRADLTRAIELVYDLAARALREWREEKRSLGAIDFVDQETHALDLLENPEFAERLAAQLDLVLVDEFQDTSPLQLALFTRLAQLAKCSVWVGDQKQAIFGFRGTDPALMDAAIDALLDGAEPSTLATSFRSRKPLVELTSSLFASAFSSHEIPAQRVKLTASKPDDPKLGASVEVWDCDGKNKDERFRAIADGVRALLDDASVRIRDRVDGALRRPRAGDVAVLCRKNIECEAVARALAAHGLPATVSQAGLLSAPEARVALLGLRLFVDARDRLAAGELARILLHPDEPDAWLQAAFDREEHALHFEDAAFHQRLARARERFPAAGPLAALEAAIDAIGVWSLLPRWGDAERRLANLDALRAHAVEYVSAADANGSAVTPAGLVAYLEALEPEGDDAQARLPGADSVVVATWHRAKGLEWPVTVLALVGEVPDPARFGFTVKTTREGFSLAAPLEGRWVRFWPNPFHPSQRTGLLAALDAAPEAAKEQHSAAKQELRVLYVAWTRARDRLVLARGDGGWMVKALAPIPEGTGEVSWGGVKVQLARRAPSNDELEVPPAEPSQWPITSGPESFPPAFVNPSNEEGVAADARVETLGARLQLTGALDVNALGQALHSFLAVDRPGLSVDTRVMLAREALERWAHAGAVSPEQLVSRSDALHAWGSRVAPGARWHHELPVTHAAGDGSVLRGVADLVLEGEDGFWLVDHKSFPGAVEAGVERAKRYVGQLDAYASALSAAWKKPCRGRFIHLVISGGVVELR